MTHILGRLTDCENRYRRNWQDFTRRWRAVKEQWRDQRREQFEQQHLSGLPTALNHLSASMGELREALQAAERELRDPDSL